MSRLSTNMSLDFRGMMAANKVALRRLQETIDQYGIDTVLSVMERSHRHVGTDRTRTPWPNCPMASIAPRPSSTTTAKRTSSTAFTWSGRRPATRSRSTFPESADQAPRFMNSGTEGGLWAGGRAAMLPILAW